MSQFTNKTPGRVQAGNVAVTVLAASNTKMLELVVEDIDQIGVSLAPATQAMDAFFMEGRMGPDDTYQTVATATWAVGGIILASSGNLAAQGAGTQGYALIDVRSFYSVRFQGSKAVADSAATIYAFGKGHKVL